MLKRFGGIGRMLIFGVAFVSALVAPVLAQPSIAPSEVNPIIAENRLPGSDAWRLNRPGYHVADDTAGQIKGYASQTSVNRGGSLVLHVSVAPAQEYWVDVFRFGWYAGHGARLVQHVGPLLGTPQAVCPNDRVTGLLACRWTASVTLQVPRDWTTGVYLALLTNAQHFQSYVPFVVRDDQRVGDLVYKQPVNTYQAYNNYPDDQRVGKSLYDQNSYGPVTISGKVRAVKVSFDRPYANDGSGQFLEWEYSLLRWLERSGYDVSYTTDADVHANPKSLLGAKAVISAGHDEYWSRSMFDAMVAARDSGEHLAFFGADAGDWQARYEPGASGDANRTLVVYRDAALDPETDPRLKTVWWRDPPLYRPPQALVGVQFQYVLTSNTDFVVNHSDSWVYANTGVKDGDTVPGIVGYEVDSAMPNFALPETSPGTYTLLSASPLVDENGAAGTSNASVYRARNGAWVFATGTMSWSWGLEPERKYDPRIQQVSANVINAFVTSELPTTAPEPHLTSYQQTVVADRPLAYWPLTDPAGPLVGDASGNHRVGLQMGGLSTAADAIASDGTGSVFLPTLPRVKDFTIEGWADLADADWNHEAFWNNALYAASGHVRMLLRPGAPAAINSQGYFGVWLNGTEYALQPLHAGVDNVDQWVYWAMVRSGPRLAVYRNGVQVAAREDLPPDVDADISGQLFAQGDSLRLKGSLRDVAIYARALTRAEVEDHFQAAGESSAGSPG